MGSSLGLDMAKSLVVISLPAHRRKCAHRILAIKGESYLVGKAVQPLQSVKNYSNSRVHGHGRTWLDFVFQKEFLCENMGIRTWSYGCPPVFWMERIEIKNSTYGRRRHVDDET